MTAATGTSPSDRAQTWLTGAMLALAVLAAAAAAVSWDAQYALVLAVKAVPAIAALEAAIPDVGAVIFASLGIALALHGRRALRPRSLNVACIGISLAMNALAAAPGWRDLAVWIMPAAVYALASDTLIGVVRARAIARTAHATGTPETLAEQPPTRANALADDEATPMAVIGGLVLWLLRLALAPASTLTGFRRWALQECPVAPGRKAPPATPTTTTAPAPAAITTARPGSGITQPPGPGTPAHPAGRLASTSPPRNGRPGKQAAMVILAGQRYDLTVLPLRRVSGIANQIAAEVSLSPGTARRVLLAHVRALQNGHQRQDTP